MYIPFDQLKTDAKIWIFQADRILNKDEVNYLAQNLRSFTEQWVAHQKPLNSSYLILNNAHIIMGVDESVHGASGCSIDTLMKLIQQCGNHLKVDFFDRKSIALLKDEEVKIISFDNLKQNVEEKILTPDTLVFNNLVQSKNQLDTDWRIKAKDSWIKRYFKTTLTT